MNCCFSRLRLLISLMLAGSYLLVDGFLISTPLASPHRSAQKRTDLSMAKKIRNKQAELAKKMELAKKQKAEDSGLTMEKEEARRLSDEEIKERNDRLRFEELLKTKNPSMNDLSSDGYLSKEQEEAMIDAYQRGVDLLFEGDPAPSQPFEELVSIRSENAIGEIGAKNLLPWLKRSQASDYLVVVCDPRVQSHQLRDTATALNGELGKDILDRLVLINADTPAENRRWLKKTGIQNINVLSDEKREWMSSYTALGENRWSTTVFVVADERVQKVAREVEPISAVQTIRNAVKSMEARRL